MNRIYLFVFICFLSSNLFAKKIVTVGGSITETLVALGHESELIGVDMSSSYPEDIVSKLPNVGYWLQLPKEGILSLKPEIVIASEKSKPKKFVDSLPSYGIKTFLIEDKPTLESAKTKIMQVATALNEKKKAEEIIKRIEVNVKKVNDEIKHKDSKPKVLFLFSRTKGLMMAAGVKTKAGAMIKLAGGKNVITQDNFTKISEESILKMNPDVIIISDHSKAGLSNSKAISSTNAGKESQIYSMDMLLISGFTVRVDEALQELSCMFNKNKLSFCK